MNTCYRIKAVSPNVYVVQEPFLFFFWRSPLFEDFCGCRFVDKFESVEEAKIALNKYVGNLRRREKNRSAIKAHISQKPTYVTYRGEP